MKPLISVIIPAYNAQNTIVECLDSVYEQTYRNIEILVINDGSVDNTLSIVEKYILLHKDLPIKVYSIKNSGPASARNYAIRLAKGEYIAFLDSDDRWVSDKLEKQINCFYKYPNIDLLGCLYSIGTEKPYITTGIKWISKNQLLFKNFFITPSVIMKSYLLHDLKFEEGHKYSEDYNLWLQIIFSNYCCALLEEPLVILCDKPTYGSSGLSAKLWSMEKGELRNYAILHKRHLIPISLYMIAVIFSFLKYIRRLFITTLKKL